MLTGLKWRKRILPQIALLAERIEKKIRPEILRKMIILVQNVWKDIKPEINFAATVGKKIPELSLEYLKFIIHINL